MRILIVEDEPPAARQLEKLIREIRPDAMIAGVLESVAGAVRWPGWNADTPQLVFMDIQLADGLSFDIFSKIEVTAPVIFTTAYDQYTLRAFKVNSIDYLLKPVEPEELGAAFRKFDLMRQPRPTVLDPALIEQLIRSVSQPAYKERFLVKSGQSLFYLPTSEIRYFYAEDGLVFARTDQNKKHSLDFTLDQLEELLHPKQFFRINRKFIAHIDAIRKISPFFNSRLILEVHPATDFEVVVSRDRVNGFKEWLDC